MNTSPNPGTEVIELTLDGRPFSFTFTSALGLRPFVEAVLTGEDYPIVFPGLYKPTTIVDIGAHAGAASVYFKSNYPEVRLFSFEPCKNSFEHLHSNTAGFSEVQVHNYGLGDQNLEAKLFTGQYSSMQHSLKPNDENTGEFELVTIRNAREALDELGLEDVSIIKVDTEGCEIEILNTIADRLSAVDVIYLEYHSESDRMELDQMLSPHFLLYASRAEEPHRGTNTYVHRRVFDLYSQQLENLYVHPKS